MVRRWEPGTGSQLPSAVCVSSLNTAPGSTVVGESASTFVSTTLPSGAGGSLAFAAVRFTTMGAGAAASMANSRGVSSST